MVCCALDGMACWLHPFPNVYTIYPHAFGETVPELMLADQVGDKRPLGLVTIVLRAYVYGLLKSCLLMCREFNKRNAYDVRLMYRDLLSYITLIFRLFRF